MQGSFETTTPSPTRQLSNTTRRVPGTECRQAEKRRRMRPRSVSLPETQRQPCNSTARRKRARVQISPPLRDIYPKAYIAGYKSCVLEAIDTFDQICQQKLYSIDDARAFQLRSPRASSASNRGSTCEHVQPQHSSLSEVTSWSKTVATLLGEMKTGQFPPCQHINVPPLVQKFIVQMIREAEQSLRSLHRTEVAREVSLTKRIGTLNLLLQNIVSASASVSAASPEPFA